MISGEQLKKAMFGKELQSVFDSFSPCYHTATLIGFYQKFQGKFVDMLLLKGEND